MPSVRSYDKMLAIAMVCLIIFGSVMIYSSTCVVAPQSGDKAAVSEFYYIKRHLFTLLLGTIALLVAYRMEPSTIEKLSVPLLIFSGFLLLLVFVPYIGIKAGGARRWIKLGFMFQPSELVKLAMVIYLATYLSRPDYDPDRFSCFIKPLGIMAVFQAVFMKQPDFGATMSLFVLTIALLFIAGTRIRYIASLLLLAVPVIYKIVQEPYRMRRITSFLDPWKDAQGSGFQLVQSFISLGSGGLTGLGLGESKQKLAYLPAKHTDFIFCLVGEELGLIGATVVILLFSLLFVRGISIANRVKSDQFLYFLAYGLTIMLAVQSIVNFSVVTGMVPTKGLPLPFMSYGGSALLVNMTIIGILLRISRGDDVRPGVIGDRKLIERKLARRRIYASKGAAV